MSVSVLSRFVPPTSAVAGQIEKIRKTLAVQSINIF
jgi:hypothetical protein